MNDKQKIINDIAQTNKKQLSVLGHMLQRSLNIIVKEIYRKTAHFIYEIIQNAEDNNYACEVPTLRFTLGKEWLKVENNEVGFDAEDVRAISDVGQSKKTETTLGYIGHKGIGFKAVFRVSDSPEIYSNDFHFRFNKTTDYVVPEWISTIREKIELRNQTTIFLPFRERSIGEDSPEVVTRKELSTLDPSIFLFLKKLSLIEYHDLVTGEKWLIHKELKPGFQDWLVIKGLETQQWMIGRQLLGGEGNPELPIDEDKKGIKQREVVVAVPIDIDGAPIGKFPEKQIFAFLPTEIEANLRFITQADFLLPADRENIHEDKEWNRVMRDRAADAFINGIKNWIKHEPFARTVLRAIPHPSEISFSFFESLYNRLIKLLRETCFLKTVSGKYLKPAKIIWTRNSELRELFPNEQLSELLGEDNVEYLHPDVEVEKHEKLLSDLGAREFSNTMLISFLSKKECVILHEDIWFNKIYEIIMDKRSEISEYLETLPIIPLENGNLASAEEKPILPPRRKGGAKGFGLGPLPLNYVRWELVREIPTRRTENEIKEHLRNSDNRRFIKDILGVSEDNPVDIIVNHIIPYFQSKIEGFDDPDNTFELIRYLKDRINEISLVFDRDNAQLGKYETIEEFILDIWQIVPLKTLRISDGKKIAALPGHDLYLEPEINRSLKEVLRYVPDAAKVDIDYYVEKEKKRGFRVSEEKAKQEWYDFFKTIGLHTIIRFRLLNYPISSENLISLGLTSMGYNHKIKNDIYSEDVETIINTINEETKLNQELSKELFHYLNHNFDDLISQFKKIKGEEWSFCLHTYHYYYQKQEKILISLGRLLRKEQWVLTKAGTFNAPENLYAVSEDKEGLVPIEETIYFPASSLKPDFQNFLGIRETIDITHIIDRLKQIKSSHEIFSIRNISELYRLLELGLNGSPERLDEVKKEFDEGLIFLESEWYSPIEVLWEGSGLGQWEAFPFLKEIYPYRKLFVELLEVPEKVNIERVNQGLKQLVLSNSKDIIKYTKLYYAYECLITSLKDEEVQKDEQLLKGPFWLATDNKFYCINDLVTADTTDLYDSKEIFCKDDNDLKILALPDPNSFDPAWLNHFYDYFVFKRLSSTEQVLEFGRITPLKQQYNGLLSLGKALAAKIRRDSPEGFEKLKENDTIPNLLATPPVGVERFVTCYHYQGIVYRDQRPRYAGFYKGRIIVNMGLPLDKDLLARDIALCIKMPDMEDFIVRVILEPYENIDLLLEKKGIRPLTFKEIESLINIAKGRPEILTEKVEIEKPVNKDEEEREEHKIVKPEIKRKTFDGINSYSVPSGSNRELIDKFHSFYGNNEILQAIRSRKPDDIYFEKGDEKIVEPPSSLRIILRRVNIDQGFLWVKRSWEKKFWGQKLEEVFLFGPDPSNQVTLWWNPQEDMLHNRNQLPIFFFNLGLTPGTVVEIYPMQNLGEFILRPIEGNTIIRDCDYLDYKDGEVSWNKTQKVEFPFLVKEEIYKEDRRFENFDALNELREKDPRGAASMVFGTIENSASLMNTDEIWKIIFRIFPYSRATVELILKNWLCFSQDKKGRWQLISTELGEPTQGFIDLVEEEEAVESFTASDETTTSRTPPQIEQETTLSFTLKEIEDFFSEVISTIKQSKIITYRQFQILIRKFAERKRRILGKTRYRQYEVGTEIIKLVIDDPEDEESLKGLKNIIDIELEAIKEPMKDLSSFPLLKEISRKIPENYLHHKIWPYIKDKIDKWVMELHFEEAKAKILCLPLIFENDLKSKEKIIKKIRYITELEEILKKEDLPVCKSMLKEFPIEEWAKKYLEEISQRINNNLINESKKYFEEGDTYKSAQTIIRVNLEFEPNEREKEVKEFVAKLAKDLYELYWKADKDKKYNIIKMAAQCYAFMGVINSDFIDIYLLLHDELVEIGQEAKALVYAGLARHLASKLNNKSALIEAEEKMNSILMRYDKCFDEAAWDKFIKESIEKHEVSNEGKTNQNGKEALREFIRSLRELQNDCEFQEPWQKEVIKNVIDNYKKID
jgi:hypothetical protein